MKPKKKYAFLAFFAITVIGSVLTAATVSGLKVEKRGATYNYVPMRPLYPKGWGYKHQGIVVGEYCISFSLPTFKE